MTFKMIFSFDNQMYQPVFLIIAIYLLFSGILYVVKSILTCTGIVD